jgi:hypothetical protein
MDEKSEVNKTIFKWLYPDKCWHEWNEAFTLKCKLCGLTEYEDTNPDNSDYFNSLDDVREAELKFIEERGWKAYYLAMVPQSKDTVNLAYEQVQHITAPASVRATAIAKALEER